MKYFQVQREPHAQIPRIARKTNSQRTINTNPNRNAEAQVRKESLSLNVYFALCPIHLAHYGNSELLILSYTLLLNDGFLPSPNLIQSAITEVYKYILRVYNSAVLHK